MTETLVALNTECASSTEDLSLSLSLFLSSSPSSPSSSSCTFWLSLLAVTSQQHAGVCGAPRLQLGAPAAAGMLHGREGMEGTEERRHGDFTGVQGGDEDSAGGDHAGDQRQQQHQHEQYEQQGEERREDGEHGLIQ